jgi:hypothetical protein
MGCPASLGVKQSTTTAKAGNFGDRKAVARAFADRQDDFCFENYAMSSCPGEQPSSAVVQLPTDIDKQDSVSAFSAPSEDALSLFDCAGVVGRGRGRGKAVAKPKGGRGQKLPKEPKEPKEPKDPKAPKEPKAKGGKGAKKKQQSLDKLTDLNAKLEVVRQTFESPNFKSLKVNSISIIAVTQPKQNVSCRFNMF